MAALVSSSAAAADRWSQIAEQGVLRVGTPGDYAPYAWHDAGPQGYRGADIALARALAMQLGLRIEFVSTSWSSLVNDAGADRFDVAVGGISITPERATTLYFSHPYARDSKQPIVRCGEERRFDTRAEIDQPGVRLIVNPGGTNERFVREEFPHGSLTVHADNRSVFDEILAGRADVMVTDSVEARLQQHMARGLCAVRVGARWAPASKAVLTARSKALRQQVDRALSAIGGARAYSAQLTAWEQQDWSANPTPLIRLSRLIDERLVIVTEVARAKWNSGAAINDPPREQALLASLRARAMTLAVPPDVVNRFFGAQIEAAKVLQTEWFGKWKSAGRGKFAGVPDLTRDIRPEIDRVTNQMLEQLALLPTGAPQHLAEASALSLVSSAAVKTARDGLQGT